MKHLTRLSSCVVVALALGAATASAANASLPEFAGPTPLSFTSKLKAITLESVGGLKVTCTSGANSGQVTGPKALTVRMKFAGCLLNGLPCSSTPTAGEIESSVLTGMLGYINAAKKQVGLDLASPGTPLLAFTCGEDLRVTVTGSVIGKLKPIDRPLLPPKHFTLKFSQAKGKQKPTKLEGGPTDVLATSLMGGPAEESGLAATDTLAFAGPLEIRA